MSEVASAFVSVMPSMKNFGKTVVTESERAGSTGGRRFGSVFAKATIGPLRTFGGIAAGIFAVDKVKDFFQGSIAEAREAQKVSALTAQVIKSTGGAAQISAKQVGNLATAISNKVGVDDEAIQSGANLLLTFKNIRNEAGSGNDIFNQTTQILTDMTAAMNHGEVTTEGLKNGAIQLGKALNDPVKGITALTRVGVTFTDQQQKQIKALEASGKTLDAQKIILRELKSEFGGAAAASTTAGQKLSVVWGNLKENVGTALLPALDAAEKGLAKALPKIEKATTAIAHTVAEKVLPRARALTSRAVSFGTDVIDAVKTAVQTGDWKSLGSSIAHGLGDALIAAMNGTGGLLDRIVKWAKGVDWGSLGLSIGKSAVSFLAGFVIGLLSNLPDALGVLAAHWQQGLAAALTLIPIGRIADGLGQVVARIPLLRIFEPLLSGIGRLGGLMEKAFSATLGRAFTFLGRAIAKGFAETGGETIGAARRFVSNVVTHLYVWADDFAKAGVRLIQGLGKGAAKSFAAVGEWFGRIGGRVVKAVGDLSHILYDIGKQIIGGLWNGMKAAWGHVSGWLGGLGGWMKKLKGPIDKDRVLLVDEGRAIMQGLQDGLSTGWGPVKAILLAAGKQIPETFAAGVKAAEGVLQSSLDGLKSQLSSLRSDRSDLASSITSGLSNFDVSAFTTGDDLVAALNKQNRRVHLERKLALRLQRAGLPPALLAQIESEDPKAAVALLRSLAGDDKTTLANISGAFNDINLTATRAGNQQGGLAFGHKIDELKAEIRGVVSELRSLRKEIGPDFANALSGATGNAKHKGSARASS